MPGSWATRPLRVSTLAFIQVAVPTKLDFSATTQFIFVCALYAVYLYAPGECVRYSGVAYSGPNKTGTLSSYTSGFGWCG
ncbi:hypothetical protein ACGF5C_04965 [Micromonospora sp. NPDC047620]|uniref:hypothetical protein n=1 Tax=Micromonospora sp. NPDC047620 TaxID=3364251 RepID=UPI00370FACA9